MSFCEISTILFLVHATHYVKNNHYFIFSVLYDIGHDYLAKMVKKYAICLYIKNKLVLSVFYMET